MCGWRTVKLAAPGPTATGSGRPVTAVRKCPTIVRSQVDICHANSAMAGDLMLCAANIDGIVMRDKSHHQEIRLDILN